MMKFFLKVHKRMTAKPRECSQLIVCPTGAYRTGVYVILDIEAERLQTTGRIRFTDTVRVIWIIQLNHFEQL